MAEAQRHKVGNKASENYGARFCAAKIIARWLISGEYPNRMLSAVDAHRAAITELVYGVVRWKRLLEWVLRQTVRRVPPPRLKAFVFTALYEIFVLGNAAHYAVLNETVAAVKKETSPKQANFVNAVLRQVLRDRRKIEADLARQKKGVRLSHPDVLVNRWINNYGEEKALRLCKWNNSRPDIIIRLNTLRPESRINILVAELNNHYCINFENGRDGSPSRPQSEDRMPRTQASQKAPPRRGGIPTLFSRVPHGLRIEDLPGYREGLFLVIDPFVVNAVELLDPKPGDTVLDACAAPGGKTFLIAEKMRATGKLLAFDRDEQRLLTLKTNMDRLGILDFVAIMKQDILDLDANTEKFDRILADVPCSNTGVIRRKPDVRWNFSLKNLVNLSATQFKMLDQLALLLKPGGRLVYSTCSLEPEENQLLVAAWLRMNPGFSLLEERNLFPPEANTDGGYTAAISTR